ncbi:hypothetical protein AXF42_Ash012295 [Apostasia shenzhenica]|uniref:BED-type domain-containing protein n=1 Tax=Apostasia shenzhenica TaxID=1088818 RepID=A0A2I0B4I4_9ASPA|nr:hypothetical protein AXF42_Ash012295 [Apostasia shenzhenica]
MTDSDSGSCDYSKENEEFPLWKYVQKLEKKNFGSGNTKFKCSYCNLAYSGSYFRVKSHLLKLSGNRIRCCLKVTSSHLAEMQKIDVEVKKAKALKTKKVLLPSATSHSVVGASSSSHSTFKMEGFNISSKKRRRGGNTDIEKAFNVQLRKQLHESVALIIYSASLPFYIARNPYWVDMLRLNAKASMKSYVPPGYNSLRTTLL